MSLLDNIRNQPPQKRNRLIWIFAGVITALLLGAWIFFGSPKHTDNGSFFNSFNEDFQAGKIFKNPLQQN